MTRWLLKIHRGFFFPFRTSVGIFQHTKMSVGTLKFEGILSGDFENSTIFRDFLALIYSKDKYWYFQQFLMTFLAINRKWIVFKPFLLLFAIFFKLFRSFLEFQTVTNPFVFWPLFVTFWHEHAYTWEKTLKTNAWDTLTFASMQSYGFFA